MYISLKDLPVQLNPDDKEKINSVKEYKKDSEGYTAFDGVKYESVITGNEKDGFIILNVEVKECKENICSEPEKM